MKPSFSRFVLLIATALAYPHAQSLAATALATGTYTCRNDSPPLANINELNMSSATGSAKFVEVKVISSNFESASPAPNLWHVCYVDKKNDSYCVPLHSAAITVYRNGGNIGTGATVTAFQANDYLVHNIPNGINGTNEFILVSDTNALTTNPKALAADYIRICTGACDASPYWSTSGGCGASLPNVGNNVKDIARYPVDGTGDWTSNTLNSNVPSSGTSGQSNSGATSTLDHIRIEHDGEGLTCLPESVTIRACADTNCTSEYTGTVTTTLSPAGWTTSNPFSFVGGHATATLSRTTAGTVTLGASGTAPVPIVTAGRCFVGTTESCSMNFVDAGFIFSTAADGAEATIANQVAGVAFGPYWLRAVRTNTTTKACEAAFTSPHPVTFAYQCIDPASCSAGNYMTLGATALGSAGATINLAFDVNGNASLGSIVYADVGRIGLTATATVGGATLNGTLKGASAPTTSFVVKPYGFAFSDIKRTSDGFANPEAADAAGGAFVKAGNSFSATVKAVAFGGAATPNFGKEAAAEGVALARTLILPSGGAAGTLSGTTVLPGGSFSNGTATVTDLAWSEVGIISLNASINDADYLGAGDVTGTSPNVGRFIPHHFHTVITGPMACSTAFATGCPVLNDGVMLSDWMAYSGQPFSMRITAYSLAGGGATGITQNYAGSFARQVTLSAFGSIGSTTAATGGNLSGNTVLASAFASGEATATTPAFSFAATPAEPANIYLRSIDTDGVSSLRDTAPTTTSVEGGVRIVSGRMLVENMYGPPGTKLPVKLRPLLYTGGNWAPNAAHTTPPSPTTDLKLCDASPPCTSTSTPTCATSNLYGILLSGAIIESPSAGVFKLLLPPPSPVEKERRSVFLVSTPSYLWGCGRETFGTFRAPYIYQRER